MGGGGRERPDVPPPAATATAEGVRSFDGMDPVLEGWKLETGNRCGLLTGSTGSQVHQRRERSIPSCLPPAEPCASKATKKREAP